MTQHQPTQEHRERLVREVRAVAEHYRERWESNPKLPVAVTMCTGNLRSEWSVSAFFALCCPYACYIPSRTPGLFWFGVDADDLTFLADAIEHDTTPDACTAIAAISSITPHTPRSEPPCA